VNARACIQDFLAVILKIIVTMTDENGRCYLGEHLVCHPPDTSIRHGGREAVGEGRSAPPCEPEYLEDAR
jgi:hypothetical protein